MKELTTEDIINQARKHSDAVQDFIEDMKNRMYSECLSWSKSTRWTDE